MNRRARFQNHLLTYRKKRGFSQKFVAKLIGHKDQSQVCTWEKGTKIPNLENAFKLGIILRTPVEFLFPDYFQTTRETLRHKEEKLSENIAQYERKTIQNQ
jgi:DNA-binding XRE family transcriptional regulator